MDSRALWAIIGFSVQLAAGVAPTLWPQYTWLASLIFWGSCLFACTCLLWWFFSNFQIRTPWKHRDKNSPETSKIKEALPLQRITFVDFRNIVRDQFHWNVSGERNLEAVDLLDGLRQAGVDKTIQFWGRRRRYNNLVLDREDPLVEIPSDHWKDFQFEWGSAITAGENIDVTTYNRSAKNWAQGSFFDIHLHREEAIEWMNSTAKAFRGKRDREERNSQRR